MLADAGRTCLLLQVTQLLSLYPGLTTLTVNGCSLVQTHTAAHWPGHNSEEQQRADAAMASTMQSLLKAAPSLTSLALAHTGLGKAVPAALVKQRPGLKALLLQDYIPQQCIPDVCRLIGLISLTLGGAGKMTTVLVALGNLQRLNLPGNAVDSTDMLDALLAATQITALTVSMCSAAH
jgi:hypothetical protein